MKVKLIAAVLAMPWMAHAQFMGISDLPMSEKQSTQLLFNSIKNGDFVVIDKWDKEIGLSIAYPDTPDEYCYANLSRTYGYDFSLNSVKFKETSPRHAPQDLSIAGQSYPFFTQCNDLSFLHVVDKFRKDSDLEDLQKLGANKSRKPLDPQYPDLLRKMVKDANPMLWEQLIPAVLNSAIPFDIRKNALQKILEIYPVKEKYGNKHQQTFWSAAKTYVEDPKGKSFASNYDAYLLSINPVQYMYDVLFMRVAKLSTVAAESEELQNLLTKNYFLGKAKIAFSDLEKINKQKNAKIAAYHVNQSVELMHMISKTDLASNNYQNFNGNTVLHRLWLKKQTIDTGSNSRIFANFLRAQFENGLNPMLLNDQKETGYSLFEKLAKDMKKAHYEPVREAFMLKEYSY